MFHFVHKLNQIAVNYLKEGQKADVFVKDGDVISLGNTNIECMETPGHTEGTLSFFFDVEYNNKLSAYCHEGEEFNNLYVRAIRTFCKENGYNVLGDKHSLENLKKLIILKK